MSKFESPRLQTTYTSYCALFGSIALAGPADLLAPFIAELIEYNRNEAEASFGRARSNDLLRIASRTDVALPEHLKREQAALIRSDAELSEKQRMSATASRSANAEKKRKLIEQQRREEKDRAEYEAWKRRRNKDRPDDAEPAVA